MKYLAILVLLVASAFAQTVSLAPVAKQIFFGSTGFYTGQPLPGGKIYTYAAGTTTPLATYTDSTGGTPNANPIILDGAGFCCGGGSGLWITSGVSYKFVVQDANGVQQWVMDNISNPSSSLPANAQFTTIIASVNGEINVKASPYGATGNGVSDDTTAIVAALAACSPGQVVFFPNGTYKTTSAITMVPGCSMRGSGRYVSILAPANASQAVFTYTGGVSASYPLTKIDISQLGFLASAANQVGISCTLCNSIHINDLLFTGFLNSIYLDRGTFATIDNVWSQGLASPSLKAGNLVLTSTSDADYVYSPTVNNYHVINVGNGVVTPLIYMRRNIGTKVLHFGNNDAHAGSAANGIVVENDSQGVMIANSTITAATEAILLQTGSGVSVTPTYTTINNVDIDQMYGTAGIDITQGLWTSILGSHITSSGVNTGAIGIYIHGGTSSLYTSIAGSTISGYNTGSGTCIALAANQNNVSLVNSMLISCVTGLGITAGTSDYISAIGNDTETSTTPIANGGTGTHNTLIGNTGVAVSLLPVSTISFGTSTNTVPVVATPTVNQAACIYAAGPPVQIGKCTSVVGAGGACTCAQ